ncbi:AI-2E family transporter [uncultured Amphritea sp.]|uniref:AI-2E family transporter n=1 Tax=uncultured Amphritea sp. TaxID=981605 RepID=UPI002625A5A1|nr:AI-2E family transporter [uncultured Amphritea sp.]
MNNLPAQVVEKNGNQPDPGIKPASALVRFMVVIVVLYTLYLAKALFMPLMVALFFSLFMSPLVTSLQRVRIPRAISSIVLITLLLVPVTLLGMSLVEPVAKWAERIPEISVYVSEELNAIEQSLMPEKGNKALAEPSGFFGLFKGQEVPAESGQSTSLSKTVMMGGVQAGMSLLGVAPQLMVQFLTVIVVTLMLLIFGPALYIAVVTELPMIKDKPAAMLLITDTQRELSRYIFTVGMINTLLGFCVGTALWGIGVEDAVLWGVMVGLLNFAPYIGPLAGMAILCIAGLIQYDFTGMAMLPVLIYFCINLLESQFVTPMALGYRFHLNPLIIILWVIFLAWLWGAVGVLLAVPFLVSAKLIARHVHPLGPWVRVMETRF